HLAVGQQRANAERNRLAALVLVDQDAERSRLIRQSVTNDVAFEEQLAGRLCQLLRLCPGGDDGREGQCNSGYYDLLHLRAPFPTTSSWDAFASSIGPNNSRFLVPPEGGVLQGLGRIPASPRGPFSRLGGDLIPFKSRRARSIFCPSIRGIR